MFTVAEGHIVDLGWHVVEPAEGWRRLNHSGGFGGYTATLKVDAKNRRAALVLRNVVNDGVPEEEVRALGRELLTQIEGM